MQAKNHIENLGGYTRPQTSGVIYYAPDTLINTADVRERSIIIRQAMLAAGVTQTDIATKAGVTQPHVHMVINNSLHIRSVSVEQEISKATGLIFPPFLKKKRGKIRVLK
jgi:hypothetical protein